MSEYPALTYVKALDDYKLLLGFSNGEEKLYDFEPNLSHPFYNKLQDYSLFKKVSVRDGELEWVTGQDFCPHTLYEKGVSLR